MIISLTPFAVNCLKEISEYILDNSKSEEITQNLISSIFEKIKLLEKHPEFGKEEELLIQTGFKYRFIIEGNYKIIYRILENKSIVITDIFHTKQNPDKIKTRETKISSK